VPSEDLAGVTVISKSLSIEEDLKRVLQKINNISERKADMNILLLEDRGAVAIPLTEKLENLGHTVFIAQNIPKAKSFFRTEEIHCIITDLNLPPKGLKDEEKKQTGNGILSGWIWLKNYVFPENEPIKKSTIILTAYPDELHGCVPSEDLAGVTVISKSLSIEEDLKRVLESTRKIVEAENEKKG
jgi:CheY-like chemotaxis protein